MNPELHPWQDRARGMLLAAAVGDALGWPHERQDRTKQLPSAEQTAGRFFAWERTGNRFRPFVEKVDAGAYSDDTQMIIAVSRALLTAGDDWQTWLERVEWPFFLAYERGAGASVKRACRAWAQGRNPWSVGDVDARKYFETGANGAAMRIAPHVVRHHADATFDQLAQAVTRDATTTHGHPRAIVGALVHAYALWISMRQPSPLPYGWLIEALLTDAEAWQQPFWQVLPSTWQRRAGKLLGQPLEKLWESTVREVEELLTDALSDLRDGAVSAPAVFLKSQGLTSIKTRGSGTLCAVAAAYLAARSASNPERGILTAARLDNADTDTLASMTASLMGAALGQEWLGSYGRNVQDHSLLSALAEALLQPVNQPRLRLPSPDEARNALASFTISLSDAAVGSHIRLPDRRVAEVIAHGTAGTKGWVRQETTLLTTDQQTLQFLHSVQRRDARHASGLIDRVVPTQERLPEGPEASGRVDAAQRVPQSTEGRSPGGSQTYLQGAYIPVHSIARVRQCLERVFGLTPSRYGDNWAAYENLVITEDASIPLTSNQPQAQLRMATDHPEQVLQRIWEFGLSISTRDDKGIFSVSIDPHLTVVFGKLGERSVAGWHDSP
ncbi:ADP-ribosylglycohydrolase family protein [Streptomyces sp. NPDC012637]|uniref:ADP-ribosylglycohydrolase family protein n=1 Tax=Streptomyces sp. NPDC012637 TaxID=3364842 RepID=UPI0036DFE6CA